MNEWMLWGLDVASNAEYIRIGEVKGCRWVGVAKNFPPFMDFSTQCFLLVVYSLWENPERWSEILLKLQTQNMQVYGYIQDWRYNKGVNDETPYFEITTSSRPIFTCHFPQMNWPLNFYLSTSPFQQPFLPFFVGTVK